MRVVRIEHVDDPRIEEYRHVGDADVLRRRNLFVAEGRLVVTRVLEMSRPVLSLLLNDASFRALEPALSVLAAETPVYICGTDDFAAITGFHLHRGCLALAERPAPAAVEDVADRSQLLLVLEAVADADNIGSAFRNAAAFGAGGVLVSPACCDPLYRKAIRTSMGSALRMPYARLENWPDDLGVLKAKGFTVVALTPARTAIDLGSCSREGRIALLIGSEGPGLSTAAEAIADVRVRIPISAGVDSLNLATAAGIALWHFTRSGSKVP
jgi:tRNA G18 (ribose-2'-O)-methylase SpoU